MRRRIYIETSVVSYLTARRSKTILGAARQLITLAWWETRSQYELLVSESVLRECGAGDPDVAKKRLAVLQDIPLRLVTEQALSIAESLVRCSICFCWAATSPHRGATSNAPLRWRGLWTRSEP